MEGHRNEVEIAYPQGGYLCWSLVLNLNYFCIVYLIKCIFRFIKVVIFIPYDFCLLETKILILFSHMILHFALQGAFVRFKYANLNFFQNDESLIKISYSK